MLEYFINYITFLDKIFLSLIIYLIVTDDRFTWIRKAFLIFLFLLLYFFSFYLDKTPFLIIQDLFWYTLLLNGSFIFHTLFLDRIFNWCWKHHYEYLGFLVSRVSFTLSLSGVHYWLGHLIHLLNYPFSWPIHLNNWWDIKEGLLDPNLIASRYSLFFINLMNNHRIIYKFFDFLGKTLRVPLWIFKMILLHFILVFHNYSLWVLGKKKVVLNETIISLWLWLFFISVFLGIPRLYMIWAIQFVIEFFNMWNHEYHHINSREDFQSLKFWDKIVYTLKNWDRQNYLYSYKKVKYKELELIYEKPYHRFFMFDLCKFLASPRDDGRSRGVWNNEGTIYEFKEDSASNYDPKVKFPITKLYEYYPWEDMALGYQIIISLLNPEPANDEYIYDLNLFNALTWCILINRDKNFLLKFNMGLSVDELSQKGSLVEWRKELKLKWNFYEN